MTSPFRRVSVFPFLGRITAILAIILYGNLGELINRIYVLV